MLPRHHVAHCFPAPAKCNARNATPAAGNRRRIADFPHRGPARPAGTIRRLHPYPLRPSTAIVLALGPGSCLLLHREERCAQRLLGKFDDRLGEPCPAGGPAADDHAFVPVRHGVACDGEGVRGAVDAAVRRRSARRRARHGNGFPRPIRRGLHADRAALNRRHSRRRESRLAGRRRPVPWRACSDSLARSGRQGSLRKGRGRHQAGAGSPKKRRAVSAVDRARASGSYPPAVATARRTWGRYIGSLRRVFGLGARSRGRR